MLSFCSQSALHLKGVGRQQRRINSNAVRPAEGMTESSEMTAVMRGLAWSGLIRRP
jgi:hypothetical protein